MPTRREVWLWWIAWSITLTAAWTWGWVFGHGTGVREATAVAEEVVRDGARKSYLSGFEDGRRYERALNQIGGSHREGPIKEETRPTDGAYN